MKSHEDRMLKLLENTKDLPSGTEAIQLQTRVSEFEMKWKSLFNKYV